MWNTVKEKKVSLLNFFHVEHKLPRDMQCGIYIMSLAAHKVPEPKKNNSRRCRKASKANDGDEVCFT